MWEPNPSEAGRPPLIDELVARCSFPAPGTRVDCGVSGGADSLALLVLAVAAGCQVTAIHVDHGLRDSSSTEAEVVARAAERFGADFESRTVELAPGPNLEARARAVRYRALPSGVLTGHTADDLAETMLLNLLRGAGLDGLAPMRGRPGAPATVQPMLSLRRAETSTLCAELGLAPVDDPSNTDPAFRRNRVRHEVLPLLDEIAARDVVPILVRQAALLGDEAALLDELASSIDPTDVRAVRAAPEPLARRAIREWLRHGSERHPPDAATVARVLDVVRGTQRATDVGAGRRVTRRDGRLTLHETTERC